MARPPNVLLITTDHGAMIGDFGQTGKGNFMEQVIRVPYLVVPPGSSESNGARRTYDGLVEHVDLVPTILDLAELKRHAERLIDYRLKTETNAWKCGLAATAPQSVDPFGLPIGAT